MNIKGSVALVTGANRGLGRPLVEGLLDGRASKVYAGARDPASVQTNGIIPVRLDVTAPADIDAAARECDDVTLVINNAGIGTSTGALADDAIEAGRREMDTNVFGTLAVSRAFAPVIEKNGGGALVNILSVLSWVSMPATAMYCASKAAAWSITNSLRVELAPRGILVVGVHCGFLDTDMTATIDAPKLAPRSIVEQVLAPLSEGRPEVLADEITARVRAALSGDLAGLYPSQVAS